jgi:hypothetical protein
MANSIVADFTTFLNQQIQAQEEVETCLWQLEALITVALMTDGIYSISKSLLQSYLSIADSLIEAASKANQMSLTELLRRVSRINK